MFDKVGPKTLLLSKTAAWCEGASSNFVLGRREWFEKVGPKTCESASSNFID